MLYTWSLLLLFFKEPPGELANTEIAELHHQSFCFNRSGVGTKKLHFKQVPADSFGSGPHFEHGFCKPSYLHIFCTDCSVEWIWCTNNETPGQNKTKFSLFCYTFTRNNIYCLLWWQDLCSFPERDLRGITIKCNFWTCLDDELNKLTIYSHPWYNQAILSMDWVFIRNLFYFLGIIMVLWLYF